MDAYRIDVIFDLWKKIKKIKKTFHNLKNDVDKGIFLLSNLKKKYVLYPYQ